ncbi:hypothetical protein B0H11DRAFT_2187564 [Mycena galericulata]|nr:hypothetical protein B0H11DRAFT_2187564 [Mycena galericulata]
MRAKSDSAIESDVSLFGRSPTTSNAATAGSPITVEPITPPPSPESTEVDSPMDTTPSGKALVRTFDPTDPMLVLDTIHIGDSVARTLFRHVLGPAAQHLPPPSTDDVIPVVDMGKHSYRVQPVVAHQYRRIFDILCAVILCAANRHNPWVMGSGRHIPAGIPLRNLIELDNRMPSICLFRVYTHLTFEERRFETIPEVLEHISTLQKIVRYFILWIANGIRVAIEQGYHSSWSYGAVIGMSDVELIHRVTKTFYYGGYSELATYMANRAEQSDIDFACAQLVSSKASHLVFTEHGADYFDPQCYIATWPLSDDRHLAVTSREPADQIVRLTLADQGVNDVEEHLKTLALDAPEESMEVDPWVV